MKRYEIVALVRNDAVYWGKTENLSCEGVYTGGFHTIAKGGVVFTTGGLSI